MLAQECIIAGSAYRLNYRVQSVEKVRWRVMTSLIREHSIDSWNQWNLEPMSLRNTVCTNELISRSQTLSNASCLHMIFSLLSEELKPKRSCREGTIGTRVASKCAREHSPHGGMCTVSAQVLSDWLTEWLTEWLTDWHSEVSPKPSLTTVRRDRTPWWAVTTKAG